MKLKVVSRVRGLSDAAFHEAFGTEEQCRGEPARLRPSRALPSGTPITVISATAAGSRPRSPQARSSIRPSCR